MTGWNLNVEIKNCKASVCLTIYQVQNGTLLGVIEKEKLTEGINSKANIHTSFLDFSGITHGWLGIFFAYWDLKIKYDFK